MKKISIINLLIIFPAIILIPISQVLAQPPPPTPTWSATPTTITFTVGGRTASFNKAAQGTIPGGGLFDHPGETFDIFTMQGAVSNYGSHVVLLASPTAGGVRAVRGLYVLRYSGEWIGNTCPSGSEYYYLNFGTLSGDKKLYCRLGDAQQVRNNLDPDPASGDIIYTIAPLATTTINVDPGTSQIPTQVLNDCKDQIPAYDSLSTGDNIFWQYVKGIQSKFNVNVFQQAYGVNNNDEALKKFLPEAQSLYNQLVVNVSPIDYYDQVHPILLRLDQDLIDSVQTHMPAGGGTAGSNCQTLPTGVGKFLGWIGCFEYDKVSAILAQKDVSHALIKGLAGIYYADAYSTNYLECIKQKLQALDPQKYKSVIDNINNSQSKIAAAKQEMAQSAQDAGIIYAAAQAKPNLWAKLFNTVRCWIRNAFIYYFYFLASFGGYFLERGY